MVSVGETLERIWLMEGLMKRSSGRAQKWYGEGKGREGLAKLVLS